MKVVDMTKTMKKLI